MRKEWLKKPVNIRPRPPLRRWMKIANRHPAGKVKAVTASGLLEAIETRANRAPDAVQKILRNGNGKFHSARGSGGKGNISKGKGQSSGQFSGHSKETSAGKGKGTSQGTKGGRGKG